MNVRFDPVVESALATALGGLDFVVAAWVFGSRAQGKRRSDSDLDVAVLVHPDAPAYEAQQRIFGAAGRVFPSHHLDLVLMNTAPPLLRHRVFRDGRLIYERDPAARACASRCHP